jgi:hypothetical protein
MRLTLPLVVAGLLVVLAGGASSTAAAPSSAARVGSLILFWSDTPYPSLWSIRPDGSHRRLVFRTRQNCKRPVLFAGPQMDRLRRRASRTGAALPVRHPGRAP